MTHTDNNQMNSTLAQIPPDDRDRPLFSTRSDAARWRWLLEHAVYPLCITFSDEVDDNKPRVFHCADELRDFINSYLPMRAAGRRAPITRPATAESLVVSDGSDVPPGAEIVMTKETLDAIVELAVSDALGLR